MSVLTGNYYTKINPQAILPNSVQKSLGKPGYMCRAINYMMEQNPAVGRQHRCPMLTAPVGSQIPSASAYRRGLLCPRQCFRWRGQRGTPVQSLGNAPPPQSHHKAAAHFFRRQTRNHLLRLTPLSSHFYLERKSRPSPWAIVQGKPISGHNRGAQPWVESSQRGGPASLGFISFPQLEKDQHSLKFRENKSKVQSGFRKTHYSQVFKIQ